MLVSQSAISMCRISLLFFLCLCCLIGGGSFELYYQITQVV